MDDFKKSFTECLSDVIDTYNISKDDIRGGLFTKPPLTGGLIEYIYPGIEFDSNGVDDFLEMIKQPIRSINDMGFDFLLIGNINMMGKKYTDVYKVIESDYAEVQFEDMSRFYRILELFSPTLLTKYKWYSKKQNTLASYRLSIIIK